MTTSRFQDHRSSRSHTGHSLILTSTWWHVCSWWATLVTSSLSSSLHNTGGLLPWTPPASTLILHISQSGLCLTLYDGQAFSAVSSHQLELKVWKVMCKMELFYSHKLLSISCYLNLAQRSGRILGCAIFSKCPMIKPMFLHSMCIGEIRSLAKFQVSSFNDLAWPPLLWIDLDIEKVIWNDLKVEFLTLSPS